MDINCTKRALRRSIACALMSFLAANAFDAVAERTYAIWTLGTSTSTDTWSAHKNDDLSEWKSVDCVEKFGSDFLLTGLTGYKEPWSNLDNFIAKLEATCTQFDRTATHTVPVFTSKNHRDDAYVLDAFNWQAHQDLMCPAYYYVGPVGQTGMIGRMALGTNPGGDYVQNFRFFPRCARMNADHTITWQTVGDSNQMINDRGYEMFDRVSVSCPAEDYVVTGIELRFEIGKGKIRDLRVLCRQLTFTYMP
jgi:hypothetical protein